MIISHFSSGPGCDHAFSGQDPNMEQIYVKRIWNEKLHSGILSHDGSLWCQAPPAHVSSLRPAPPASIGKEHHVEIQVNSGPLVVQMPSLTPRAADKPKLSGASFSLRASAKPKLSGAAQACNCGHGTATSSSTHHLRVWRTQLTTHPGNAACRAKFLEPSSGDQRGRGLAFNLTVVGSGRDAVSNGAGSGPYQTLPGCPVGVVKHVWMHPSCGSATAGDQDGLQEQAQARSRSSNVN